MMRKVREKIMSAIVVLCMILACTNSIVAEEVTISGFVEQLDIADEMTLSNYFQNRAENFYGNTVESGWIKEEQQQRILALEQWKKDCEFCIENVNIEFVVGLIMKIVRDQCYLKRFMSFMFQKKVMQLCQIVTLNILDIHMEVKMK